MRITVLSPDRARDGHQELDTLVLPAVGSLIVTPNMRSWIVSKVVFDWSGSSKYPEIRVYTQEVWEPHPQGV